MGFLEFLEQTALATFIRESSSFLGFPTFLFLHTLGLSLLVGANCIVSMRVLGMASSIPLRPMQRLFPFMWLGLLLTVISGIGLTIASATSKLVNPILLIKLVLVVTATFIMWLMDKKIFRSAADVTKAEAGKGMAAAILVLWLFVMILGRLIAYSSTIFGN